jgi:hypothetical protein
LNDWVEDIMCELVQRTIIIMAHDSASSALVVVSVVSMKGLLRCLCSMTPIRLPLECSKQ